MQHLRLLFDVSTDGQCVGVSLRLAEDHGSAVTAAVDGQHAADGRRPIVIETLNRQVLQQRYSDQQKSQMQRLYMYRHTSSNIEAHLSTHRHTVRTCTNVAVFTRSCPIIFTIFLSSLMYLLPISSTHGGMVAENKSVCGFAVLSSEQADN